MGKLFEGNWYRSVDPTTKAVSLDFAKEYLGVTFNEHNTLIESMLKGAIRDLEDKYSVQLITATWVTKLDAFPNTDTILLAVGPVQSITSISYVDVNGDSQTLSTDVYTIDTTSRIPRIYLDYNQAWPSTRAVKNAVTITAVCGHGDATTDVPNEAKQAVMVLAAALYDPDRNFGKGTDPTEAWKLAGTLMGSIGAEYVA